MAAVRAQPSLAATLRLLNSPLPDDQVFMVRARARHVVRENARVLEGVSALRRGDAATFGGLMNAAHESMSRDYDASCREVDILADLVRRAPGVLGARVTGAGWGGCVVALAKDADFSIEESMAQPYHEATGLTAEAFVCRSGPGAGVVIEAEV